MQAIARSDGTRASVLEELRATRVKDGLLGSFRFDRNGDLTPGHEPILRITGTTPPQAGLPQQLPGRDHRPGGRDSAAPGPVRWGPASV